LAAGGTIGVIGDAGVRGFGLKAGRKWFWGEGGDGGDDQGGDFGSAGAAEAANKLYVGMLIMLIFSEALAL
jgi:ATP synthase subunit C